MKRLSIWFREIFRVCIAEFRVMFHDAGLLVFVLVLPLAYPVIYSLIYNPEIVRDVKTVVVDHDRTAMSRELVRKFDACQGARVIGYAADLPEARKAVNSHEAYGILEIPAGFAKKLGNGEVGTPVLYCEMSLLLRYKALLVSATDVMLNMGAELQTETIDRIPMGGTFGMGDPLPIHEINMGNISAGFDSFIMPGVVILILQQCLVLALGMRGGARRESPELIGYNPINACRSVSATMLGQMLTYFIILLPGIVWLVHYIPLIFRFPMAGNPWEILTFLFPMVLASMGLGLCVQTIVWERESIFVLWVVTSLIFLFLSGLTWPMYAMPEVWKWLASIFPATWGVEGFIRMNANGASLEQVSDAYRNLWILAGAYFVLAYVLHRWVIRTTEIRTDLPAGSVAPGE